MLRNLFLAFAVGQVGTFAQAENSEERVFLTANILGIFYHELGHAVIDIEGVPVFGQEEDAADVFSIYLIDTFFEAQTALQLAYDAAFGFAGEADAREGDVAWWDVHGPDEQRYYNTVCIFYGADPENRQDFAEELGLPEDRQDYCPDEYDQANAAWGGVLDQMAEAGPGDTIVFEGGDGLAAEIIGGEVDALNAEFSLRNTLTVAIEECGEANAFYDPAALRITYCSEFTDHLAKMFARF